MSQLEKEAFGPHGDASSHLSREQLNAALDALPQTPQEAGQLVLIVRRLANGIREEPKSVRLTPEEGVPGDGWNRRPPRDPEAQLAVIQRDVAELIANGQPLNVSGDNLVVDLDLSAANLPVGSVVQVGEAMVAVTPKPHDGCLKFKQRFGQDALKFVSDKATRERNLRGIYWKVTKAGEARVGDPIHVISRG